MRARIFRGHILFVLSIQLSLTEKNIKFVVNEGAVPWHAPLFIF
jgi:hypothetical protein